MRSKKDARIGGIHSMVQLKSHLVWGMNEKAKCSKKINGGGWFCRTGGGWRVRSKKDARIGGIHSMVQSKLHLVWVRMWCD